jgi:ribosome-associated protein
VSGGDDDDLVVNSRVTIPRAELEFRASRSGGPGGQHVNTSSTRVELRWNAARSRALDEAQRARVIERLASRIDSEGVVRVVASASRSQRQNRAAAETRLAELVRAALAVPRRRVKTAVPRAAKEARLAEKRRRGERKRQRREPPELS